MSRTTDHSIIFYTDLPYAAIHNDGGDIIVTERMRRYFWYRYSQARGAFTRTKTGRKRKTRRNLQLTDEAEFWKHMALMKVGRKIHIPRRRFLGVSPEVQRIVREIIEENITDYLTAEFTIQRK